MLILFYFSQHDTKLGLSVKRETLLTKCSHQVGLWASMWGIFLIFDWCGKAQPTGDGMHDPLAEGLGRMQVEQATRSKAVSSTAPWWLLVQSPRPGSCLEHMLSFPLMEDFYVEV